MSLDKFAAGAIIGVLIGLAAAYSGKARAADTWISATVASYHFDRTVDHNEHNWGLGFEHGLSGNWRVVGGYYRNSYAKRTVYAGFLWLPLHDGNLHAGLTLAGATGYTNPVDPIVLPTIAWEGKTLGANLGVMPALNKKIVNVIGLQLKVRF